MLIQSRVTLNVSYLDWATAISNTPVFAICCRPKASVLETIILRIVNKFSFIAQDY